MKSTESGLDALSEENIILWLMWWLMFYQLKYTFYLWAYILDAFFEKNIIRLMYKLMFYQLKYTIYQYTLKKYYQKYEWLTIV